MRVMEIKSELLKRYERILTKALGQLEIGMWYETINVDGRLVVICHSPTGNNYQITSGGLCCNCPHNTGVHGWCKHLIGYSVWLNYEPKELYKKVAKDTSSRILISTEHLEIKLLNGQLIYQNGRTVTSEPMVAADGTMKPNWLNSYNSWRDMCKEQPAETQG